MGPLRDPQKGVLDPPKGVFWPYMAKKGVFGCFWPFGTIVVYGAGSMPQRGDLEVILAVFGCFGCFGCFSRIWPFATLDPPF